LFKRLRINLLYLEDLFVEVSGTRRNVIRHVNSKYIQQRDIILNILRVETGKTFNELHVLLKKEGLNMSFQQIGKICSKFGDFSSVSGEKEVKTDEIVAEVGENEENSAKNDDLEQNSDDFV